MHDLNIMFTEEDVPAGACGAAFGAFSELSDDPPSAGGDIWHPSAHAVPAASLLTRSMIVSTPGLVTPVRRRPWSVSHSCGDVINA
jgi:hypothetical protein